MNTLSDIRTALSSDLNISSNSSLYPTDTLNSAINRVYLMIAGMHRWPDTEDAKKTYVIADKEYYDYPQDWRPDSIWKLRIDDKDYGDPLQFKDYLLKKQRNHDPSEKYWANHKRWFFVHPVATTNGSSATLHIWGHKTITELSDNDDVTIFSYSYPELNEAIELEALERLLSKGENINKAAIQNTKAMTIIETTWKRIREENAKYEKEEPMWEVPDYYSPGAGTGNKTIIGNFDI